MSWATRKKLLYLLIVLIFLGGLISVPAYFYINKPPTCTDGKQNGGERGIDCGGACDKVCISDARELVVHFTRVFEVVPGVYDVVSFIENPNVGFGIQEIIYQFKLYDEDNILVAGKRGKTFVDSAEQFAVFEGNIRTGQRVPKRAFFEFETVPQWERVSSGGSIIPRISILDQVFENEENKARLKATLANNTPIAINNVDVTAMLYDGNGNTIAVSATRIKVIEKNREEQVVFTWQNTFEENPVRIDIMPRVNPFLQR